MTANPEDVVATRARWYEADPVLTLGLDHVSTVIAAVSSALVIFRALSVSGFRPETALVLLSSAGIPGLLLATVQTVVPFAAPWVVVLLFMEASRWDKVPAWRWGAWSVLLTAALVGALGASLAYLSVVTALVVGIRLAEHFGRRTGVLRGAALSTAGALVLMMLTNSQPWIAPEEMTVAGATYTA